MYYTYCYLNEDSKPYYVGKGSGNRAYDDNHSVSLPPRERILILKDNLTEDEAFKHEIYMIEILGRLNTGTGILQNMTKGGKQPPKFVKHSPETVEGMKRRRHSEETKRKIGAASKGRPCKEEVKQKLSKLWTGRNLSDETKRKMSEAAKGKPRPKSAETRRKMSEAAKRRWARKD